MRRCLWIELDILVSIAGIEKHIFESLRGAEKVLRAQFNEILTRYSEQLTYMGKKEKQTWQCLDLIKDDCEKMKRQVEEKVNKQVRPMLPVTY